MWLKNDSQFFCRIEFLHRYQERTQFLWMVRVIIYIYVCRCFDYILKPSLRPSKRHQRRFDLLFCYSKPQRNRHSGNSIFHIMKSRDPQRYISYFRLSTDVIEIKRPIFYMDIACIGITHIRLCVSYVTTKRQSLFYDRHTVWDDALQKKFKGFNEVLGIPIDIQMIGICGGNDSDIWM